MEQYSPRKSNKVSDTRYIGKICEKHPNEKGMRVMRTGACVECAHLSRAKYVASVKGQVTRAMNREDKASDRALEIQVVKMREAQTRILATEIAKKAGMTGRDDWQFKNREAAEQIAREMGLGLRDEAGAWTESKKRAS